MLHRYSHTLPWSVSKLGKPSDLPDVLREDLLLLIPVDPYKIFAAWNVSYQTQNTVSKLNLDVEWEMKSFGTER